MSRRTSPWIPNLDGLRAVSIAAVFLFHAQVPGFGGGFLGVSLFFTISGYLLGLRLADRPLDRRALGRYWLGRARRLLPLAWAVAAAVVAVEVLTDTTVADAPRRLWTTVVGLANWQQLAAGESYASLFAAPDALVHFWSLAIEQQVYLVLPLVLLAVWRLGSHPRRVVAIAGLAAASFLLPFLTGWSVSRTYYGTDTRAGEILIGVALALVHRWRSVGPAELGVRAAIRHDLVAGWALIAMATFVVLATPGGAAITHGLLPAQAAVSVVLVHVAVRHRRMWGGVLERPLFVVVGTLSYAIYLVHWPLLVAFGRDGWERAPATAAIAVASLAASALLVRFVETPFRSGRHDRALASLLAGAVLVVPITAAIVPTSTTVAYLDQLEADAAALGLAATRRPDTTTTTAATTPVTTTRAATPTTVPTSTSSTVRPTGASIVPEAAIPPDPGPATVAVFGDSIALSIGLALAHHPVPDVSLVGMATMLGCGVLPVEPGERCAVVPSIWDDTLAITPIDVALVSSCQWELIEREVPGIGRSVIGEPAFDEVLRRSIDDAVRRLLSGGARHVAWVNCADFAASVGWPPEALFQASRDPARVSALDTMIAEVIGGYGDRAEVVDLHAWMGGRTEDAAIRPDGSHYAYEPETAFTLALGELLSPAVDRVLGRAGAASG